MGDWDRGGGGAEARGAGEGVGVGDVRAGCRSRAGTVAIARRALERLRGAAPVASAFLWLLLLVSSCVASLVRSVSSACSSFLLLCLPSSLRFRGVCSSSCRRVGGGVSSSLALLLLLRFFWSGAVAVHKGAGLGGWGSGIAGWGWPWALGLRCGGVCVRPPARLGGCVGVDTPSPSHWGVAGLRVCKRLLPLGGARVCVGLPLWGCVHLFLGHGVALC